MNPKLAGIFRRRSIRAYQERDVDDAVVRDLLEAAMAAPSAVCCDPWRFVVVRERKMRGEVAARLPSGKMLTQAPVGLVVCGDLSTAHDRQLSFLLQDCSAAIENLLLAASMLGLGACWLGIHPRKDRIRQVTRVLDLPRHVIPVAAIALGWPAEQKSPRTRFDQAKVHLDRW